MNQELFYNRQWAETVRLYSGLLEEGERIEFIKKISEKDVLLAAECRTTSILDEQEIDQHLTEIALVAAKQFKESQTSAKGIMALVELGKFDEITKIFSSLKDNANNKLYNDVVANYIGSGNELQISTFLLVLAASNKRLLDKAIDRIFDLNLFFSPLSLSQIEQLISNLLSEGQLLLATKLICASGVKVKSIDKQLMINTLLESKQVRYVERMVDVYSFSPKIDIDLYLSVFLRETYFRDFLRFLELCKRVKSGYDLNKIRLEFSKHYNPRIKALAYEYEPSIPLSQELVINIYLENIKIANYSSIEFALSIVEKFGLQEKVGVNFVIETLLSKPTVKRLELAYTLIKQNQLSSIYPYNFLVDLAINYNNIESYKLAKTIILNEFDKNFVHQKLLYLCCIMIIEQSAYKQVKEIFFNDLQSSNQVDDFVEGVSYYGFVANYYKRTYQISTAIKGSQINASIDKVGKLYTQDFISFVVVEKSEKLSDYNITLLKTNIIQSLSNKLYFRNLFIGKIVELTVKVVNEYNVYLNHSEYFDLRFFVHIKEVANTYIRNIKDYVSLNEVVKVKIIDFDRKNKLVFCSLKEIINIKDKEDLNDKMIEKIDLLKEKFRKK